MIYKGHNFLRYLISTECFNVKTKRCSISIFFKFVHKSTKRQTVTQQHQSKNKPIYLDSEIQHTIIPRVKSSRLRTFFSKFKKLPCQDIEPAAEETTSAPI